MSCVFVLMTPIFDKPGCPAAADHKQTCGHKSVVHPGPLSFVLNFVPPQMETVAPRRECGKW